MFLLRRVGGAVGEEEARSSGPWTGLEGGCLAWVGDAVLADDDGAVGEGGGDVVGEVGVDGWDDADQMALSKLPLKRRAPVRKRLPTLAEVKSKVDEGGRARLRISRFSRLKNERISSFLAGVIDFQSSEVPSTIDCHAPWAATASEGSRWLNKVLIAARSEFGGESGIRRTSLPLNKQSLLSRILLKTSTRLLAALPPEKTTIPLLGDAVDMAP
ncbi:hypothetical protein CNMCM8980_001686 [Aspergillus fumigatiaffinis]|nr:hypothetical protein CNMCM8980_001686 [Aspergillus fumigatiaffinis]